MKLSSSLATFWLPTLLLSALSCSGVEAAPTKPNVLLIMADDNNYVSWTIGDNCCKFLCFVGVSWGY